MAKTLAPKIPESSIIHFGILTSLRSWNFFEVSNSIQSASNVGGFGTDGILSSLLGASLVNPNKLHFCVIGDLAFFYDMNALGNRHLGNNLRILLVNNGKGCEFTHHLNPGHVFEENVNQYIAAAGHYGNQSPTLVRDYACNLGMDYLTANTKETFLANMEAFVNPVINNSCVFEVFTRDIDENEALKIMANVASMKHQIKEGIKSTVGENGIKFIRDLIKK